jgi:hypothetical protein
VLRQEVSFCARQNIADIQPLQATCVDDKLALAMAQTATRTLPSEAAWAETEGIEWFHFAAFDKTWKIHVEGDVGALQPHPYGR